VSHINIRHREYPVPLAQDGHRKGSHGYDSALRGCPTWFDVIIDDVGKYKTITFEASFKYEVSEVSPDEWRQHSRIGIWTAVKDSPSVVNVSTRSDAYPHGKQSNFSILLNDWRFGKDAQIVFQLEDTHSEDKIGLSLCAVPFFHARDKTDAKTDVTLTLRGIERGDHHSTFIEEEIIHFNPDTRKTNTDEQIELSIFDKYGAFQLEGDGNSVHPKQLYTAMALKQLLDQNGDKGVDVGYIGTDTTENLRSIIRQLKTNTSFDNVRKLVVYYHEGWDEKINKKFPLIRLKAENSGDKFELDFVKLPTDGTVPDEAKPVDIIISTYVTPWAMNDDKNKRQYSELIQKLLSKENSKLISVDPESSEKVIRSYTEYFNLQDMYVGELGLKNIHEPFDDSNNVVDCTIWAMRGVNE